MRAVCQRVSWARVRMGGQLVGEIGRGWAILLGVGLNDDETAVATLVDKIVTTRAFEDESGKMGRSAEDVGAEFLVVSQITLHADLSKGRRPSFARAAPPEQAQALVEHFARLLHERGFRVATGQFGAMMDVELCNQGPVTLALSTDGWT